MPPTRPPMKVRAMISPFSRPSRCSPKAGLWKSADQAADEIVEEDPPRGLEPLRLQNRVDQLQAMLGIVVDQHVIIFGPMAYLDRRARHPAGDHRVAVGAARTQAPLQLRHRGRQDEYPDDVRIDLL